MAALDLGQDRSLGRHGRESGVLGCQAGGQVRLIRAHAGLSAGMGANQAYLASSLAADRQWISLKAAYIFAGDQFRRIVVQTPLNSETDRENILLTLHPKPFLDLSVGRFNFLQPVSASSGTIRATLDQYIANARGMKFTLPGSLFQSQVLGIN